MAGIHETVRGFVNQAAVELGGTAPLPLVYQQTAQAYALLFPEYGTLAQARRALTAVLRSGDQVGLGDADQTALALLINQQLPLVAGLDIQGSAPRWGTSLEQAARVVSGALGEPHVLRKGAPAGLDTASSVRVLGLVAAGLTALVLFARRK